MKRGLLRRIRVFLPALLLASWPTIAMAIDSSEAPDLAQKSVREVERDAAGVQAVIDNAKAALKTPAQRIADADILLRSGDTKRAINLLHQVLEQNPPSTAAHADALAMLGDAYFRSKQMLSSRRVFNELVDNGNEARNTPYLGHAFARLVDIALKSRRQKG
ncbi:MAG: hypothetical protein U0165_13755 [Polyangiaceae bacterium]